MRVVSHNMFYFVVAGSGKHLSQLIADVLLACGGRSRQRGTDMVEEVLAVGEGNCALD